MKVEAIWRSMMPVYICDLKQQSRHVVIKIVTANTITIHQIPFIIPIIMRAMNTK